MFLSMGNISASGDVGLLFIDFEKPNRLRLQGRAELSRDPALIAEYREADLVVKVAVRAVFSNCPRYVHRYDKIAPSRYVPREDRETPLASWKRIDIIQDVLPERDTGRVEASGGIISEEAWIGKIIAGDPEA
jgi:hypothetical protein